MTISGQGTASTDTAQRGSVRAEVAAWAEVAQTKAAPTWVVCTGVIRTGVARTGMAEAASPGWRR
jgi:hypothetical protein